MFEGYVVYYLNQYLGKYVDGIDQKSLRCAATRRLPVCSACDRFADGRPASCLVCLLPAQPAPRLPSKAEHII